MHAVQARCTVDGTPPSVYYSGALYSNTSTILRPSVLARCARCIIYNSFLLRTSHCPVDSHHDCIFSFLEVGAAFFTCFRGAPYSNIMPPVSRRNFLLWISGYSGSEHCRSRGTPHRAFYAAIPIPGQQRTAY